MKIIKVNVLDSETTFLKTVKWYKAYYEEDRNILTSCDLESYVADVKNKKLEWSK